ncbi:glutamine--fructose-6-phosphate transaminase (isomerizing) [Leptolyngbya sp. 7M]|nr:glutamine--fructose-6-phosphate transaminase (isomerizing) [Leptolyngbya sp. 7M]
MPLIIDGLRKLEYRGYDSAGIAVVDEERRLELRRAEGKLRNLEEAIRLAPLDGTYGIGHTRWATHGRPTEENAHPHRDQTGKIVVVHNGIIENYLTLKERLAAEGHEFKTETDTEVVAHLIGYFAEKEGLSLELAVRKAVAELRGIFALSIISVDEPDTVIAVREGAPIVVGLGDGEFFVASDIPAILQHTRDVFYLGEREIAVLTKESVRVTDFDGNVVEPKQQRITWDPIMAEKGGFKHFMLKEIYEQPRAVRDTVQGRVSLDTGRVYLDEMDISEEDFRSISSIKIAACGTSWHAGLAGKYMIEKLARVPVDVDYASEFRYRDPVLNENDLLIVISQSGETADTIGEHDARSRRFEREVELASSLRHAGIVSVLHCERLRDTRCALIMEYIDGVPIDEWAASLSADPADRSARECLRAKLRALSLVAEALHHAHAHGVVHRDLKPENILVRPDGEVRIVDFGVAKRAHDLARATLTGGFSGTLAYAAPEQLSALDERVDIRADIYSLGVVMYEVLAGRRPFDSHRPLEVVIRDVIEAAPPPLGRLLPERVPGMADIDAVVAKALAKRPEGRYQSAAAMQEDIVCLIDGRPVSARLPGTVETLKSLAFRHRIAFGLASVAVALLCVIALGMTWASVRLSSQKELLAEALFVSNIERGRTESNAGNLVRAEKQLWPELIAAGADPANASVLFKGSPRQLQAAWALAELYARVPSVLSQPVPPGSQPIGFAQGGEILQIVHPDGTERTVSLRDGSWTEHAKGPGGGSGARVSSSGRHVIVTTPDGCLLREAGGETLVKMDRSAIQGNQIWDVSSDGTRMLVVTPQSGVELWSVSPVAAVAVLASSGFTSNRPSFSLKGDRVLWGCDDAIRAWTSSSGVACGEWRF